MMLAAALAGALLLLIPALLKTRLGVDEVVTTLLGNFIVLLFVSMMLDGPMKDPMAMGWPQSVALNGDLELGKLIERTRAHRPVVGGRPGAGPVAAEPLRCSASRCARSAPTRTPRASWDCLSAA